MDNTRLISKLYDLRNSHATKEVVEVSFEFEEVNKIILGIRLIDSLEAILDEEVEVVAKIGGGNK